mgnify:CR=1 FL=1
MIFSEQPPMTHPCTPGTRRRPAAAALDAAAATQTQMAAKVQARLQERVVTELRKIQKLCPCDAKENSGPAPASGGNGQAPDDVAELGIGADPAEEARQGSPRRRAARAASLERAKEDEVLSSGPVAAAAERAGRRDAIRIKPKRRRIDEMRNDKIPYRLGVEVLQRFQLIQHAPIARKDTRYRLRLFNLPFWHV